MLPTYGLDLQHYRGFVELQARIAREQLALVSVAEVADKICFPLAVRKEFRIEFIRVEAGHRPAIQPQSARSQDEIGSLQGAIAEGSFVNQGLVPDKIGTHIVLRKKLGKIFVEFRVPGDDDRDWSGHCLFDISRSQSWLEAFLCSPRGDKNESRGRGIGAGWPKAGQIVSLAEELGWHGVGQPRRMCPRIAEQASESIL